MKSLIVLGLGLGAAFFLLRGGGSLVDGYYENSDGGFGVQFPSDWSKIDVPYATLGVQSADEEGTCTVLVQDVPAETTVDELVALAEKRGHVTRRQRLAHDFVRVGGVDGYRSMASMKVGGQRFRTVELNLVDEGTAVTVQCLAYDESFEAQQYTLSRILDSFTWL